MKTVIKKQQMASRRGEPKPKQEPTWCEEEIMAETGIARTFAKKIVEFCAANSIDLDSCLWEVAAGPSHLAKQGDHTLEEAEKRCVGVRADIEAGRLKGLLYARNGFFFVA